MPTDPTPDPFAVYVALWLGALRAATGATIDPFPDELDDLAAAYFEMFPPAAKA